MRHCIGREHHEEQGDEEDQVDEERSPENVGLVLAGGVEEVLQGQHHPSLRPTLHGREVVHGVLRHAPGQPAVDVLRASSLLGLIQATGCVLHLTALGELHALDQHLLVPGSADEHAVGGILPQGALKVSVRQQPCTIRAAGCHATAAVTDHAVETEELCVVVVEVVGLVLHLGEVLRRLCKCNLLFQLAVKGVRVLEKVRDGGHHEVRLELVPSVADGEEARSANGALSERVAEGGVLRTPVPQLPHVPVKVVLAEVQAAGFAAAGPQRDQDVPQRVSVATVGAIEERLPAILQPLRHVRGLRVGGVPRDLVAPHATPDALHGDGARVLERPGARDVVQPQGLAEQVLGLVAGLHFLVLPRWPPCAVVELGDVVLADELVLATAVSERGDPGLQLRLELLGELGLLLALAVRRVLLAAFVVLVRPLVPLVLQLVERVLPADAGQRVDLPVGVVLDKLGLQLLQRHGLRVMDPLGEEPEGKLHVPLEQALTHAGEFLPHFLHVRTVALVRQDDVERAETDLWHARDGADQVAQHHALGLATARAADGDVLELRAHPLLVLLRALVGREDAREIGKKLDTEANNHRREHHVEEHRVVLRRFDFVHEILHVDVAIWVAPLHVVVVRVSHAGMRASPRNRKAAVVEGRPTHEHARHEVAVDVRRRVHDARDDIQRAAAGDADIGAQDDAVQLHEVHLVVPVVPHAARRDRHEGLVRQQRLL
mmetsp:Transcript_98916/g.255739  ORF Transcript_98916/g.255739 Transcript_98916/m.255739 type:complete len:718 (+) Transcript_98916:1242-3395(+)